MSAYVIKQWKADSRPDSDGVYVKIVGRAGGIISWVLAQLTIDPTVSLVVKGDKLLFEQGSLGGSVKRVVRLNNISSSFYGYTKPWKESLAIGIIAGLLTFWMLGLGAIIGVIHYVLNKTLTVGIVEVSGVVSDIQFKRSVIEGQRIDEPQARMVCDIIDDLIDKGQSAPVGVLDTF